MTPMTPDWIEAQRPGFEAAMRKHWDATDEDFKRHPKYPNDYWDGMIIGSFQGWLAAKADSAETEAWLRGLLTWCRSRLRPQGYAETLDRYLAKGPTKTDLTPVVLSAPPARQVPDDAA